MLKNELFYDAWHDKSGSFVAKEWVKLWDIATFVLSFSLKTFILPKFLSVQATIPYFFSCQRVVGVGREGSAGCESSRVESSRVESSGVESSRVESSRVESSRVEWRFTGRR